MFHQIAFQAFLILIILTPVASAVTAPIFVLTIGKNSQLLRVDYQNRLALFFGLTVSICVLSLYGYLGAYLPSPATGNDGKLAVRYLDISKITATFFSSLFFAVCIRLAAKRLKGMGFNRFYSLFGILPIFGPLFLFWLAYTVKEKSVRSSRGNIHIKNSVSDGSSRIEPSSNLRERIKRLLSRLVIITLTLVAAAFSINWFGFLDNSQLISCENTLFKIENKIFGKQNAATRRNGKWQDLDIICDANLEVSTDSIVCNQRVKYQYSQVTPLIHTRDTVWLARQEQGKIWDTCISKPRKGGILCFLELVNTADKDLNLSRAAYVKKYSPSIGESFKKEIEHEANGEITFIIDFLTSSWTANYPGKILKSPTNELMNTTKDGGYCKKIS
jgi:hypothetical protein